MPVTLNGRTPLVTVQVDGKPAVMVLETGAESTALTVSGAQRLGIVADPTRTSLSGGISGLTRVPTAAVGPIALGPLSLAESRRLVLALPTLEALRPTPGDGLLGIDLLSQADVDLDLPHGRMTLYPVGLCRAGLPNWKRPYAALPTWQATNLWLGTQVELDGRSFQALLDTGSAGTLIDKRATALLDLPEPPANIRRTQAHGIGDTPHDIYPYRFREMRIGPTRFPNPVLGVIDRPGYGFQAAPFLLGAQYTNTQHLWLSYAARRIFVERAAAPPSPNNPAPGKAATNSAAPGDAARSVAP
ncbi:aspartyl protease family protein [Roseomonas elaeocarpi]|uniref:Aspartyl protease family protein n=1 Tax=Roseomonas elaeocarpi TaxID=907779 RepID=A0ABV6JMV1_9PROT